MATSILIPLFDPKTCFKWLGPCTVLTRLLSKLNDVRDIDSIRIVTDNPQVPTLLRSWLEDPEHAVDVLQAIPENLLGLCKHYIQPDFTYVVCNPLFPFVSEETINRVLFAAQSSPTVVTTSEGYGLIERNSTTRLQQVRIVHPVCLAVNSWSSLLTSTDVESIPVGEHESVSLTEVEALSLDSLEGLAVAKILSTYYA